MGIKQGGPPNGMIACPLKNNGSNKRLELLFKLLKMGVSRTHSYSWVLGFPLYAIQEQIPSKSPNTPNADLPHNDRVSWRRLWKGATDTPPLAAICLNLFF